MKKVEITLKVNGEEYELEIEPHRTLVEVLRETLGFTGTKKSCNEGECGACTVIMDGKPVASCLVLALDADGKEITTIEGLARGENLHPLQVAFVRQGGIQCGFCTPGMIMSAKALLDKNPKPTTTGGEEGHFRQSLPVYGISADCGCGDDRRARNEQMRTACDRESDLLRCLRPVARRTTRYALAHRG